jgi:hypothetical protein
MANEYVLKDYKGSSIATTLSSSYATIDSTFTVASGSTFPDGSSGPFVVVISRGLADEEKMLIGSRTGNVFTILEKGYDGTTSLAHPAASSVNHCLDAYTLVQANRYVNLQATKGSLVTRTASTTVTLPAGTNGHTLVADSTATNGIVWQKIATAGIAAGAVTDTEIGASANIAFSKLATTGTVTATTFIGALSGNATSATSATTAGTVTTAAQPAITSVGTLSSLAVTAGVTAATFTGSPSAATTTTAANGVGYMGLPRTVATTGNYTIVAADAGTQIYSTGTRTITIPANATLAMPIGSTIVLVNNSAGLVTIAITTDTLNLAGVGTTGSRTLDNWGMATLVKYTTTGWIISGNGLT